MIRILGIDVALGLSHINLLFQITMKKSILNINLIDVLVGRNNQGQYSSNCGMSNNRTECLIKNDTHLLMKALGNKSSLESLYGTISLFLIL